MPKGIYNRTDRHALASSINGKKQKGILPVNAKYISGYMQDDFKILRRITPIGKKTDGKRIIEFECECISCGEVKKLTSGDFTNHYKTKCSDKIKPHNWTGYGLISGSYWKRIQNQAKDRNIKFNCTIEEAWHLYEKQNKKCAYTGIILDFSKRKSGNIASLDRIDNTKGYELGNVHWVHKDINMMKRNFSEEYFIDLCQKVILNRQDKA